MKKEINETKNTRGDKKKYTHAELQGWIGEQEKKDEKIEPNFLGGKGTASEGYREAWKTRDDCSRFLKFGDKIAGGSVSKGKYLAPEMAKKCGQYYDELRVFVGDKANEQKIKDVLGMSADDFQLTLNEWKKMADNYTSIARSAHEKLPDQSFTSEQREQAFQLLAVVLDKFQYMRWRVNNDDKGILDEETLKKACEILTQSKKESPEYCRAFLTICDAVDSTQNSHNGASDRPSREQQPSGVLEIEEIPEVDGTTTPSDNVVIAHPKIAELKGKEIIIEHLLRLKEIEERCKHIPEINYGVEENVFKEIQAFIKKYCINHNGKENHIKSLQGQIGQITKQNGVITKELRKIQKEGQDDESKEEKLKLLNERLTINLDIMDEYDKEIDRIKSIDGRKLDEPYKDNCDTEKILDKTLDEIRQFREKIEEEIKIDSKQQPQAGGLLSFAKNELVRRARQLETSVDRTREYLRGMLIDQAQLIGKFANHYCLEHQRYAYEPSRAVFLQGNESRCGEVCIAMLVADQYLNRAKDLIKIAKKAFPDIDVKDNDTPEEIVRKAFIDVKLKRGRILIIGSDKADQLIVLNKLLGSTDKEYVLLLKVRNDEWRYFIQASMDYKEGGSIATGWSHREEGHAVILDSRITTARGEERVNVRDPAEGAYGVREDLHSCYFTGELLVPLETWKEFVTECQKNKRKTEIIRVVPNLSGPELKGLRVGHSHVSASDSDVRKALRLK